VMGLAMYKAASSNTAHKPLVVELALDEQQLQRLAGHIAKLAPGGQQAVQVVAAAASSVPAHRANRCEAAAATAVLLDQEKRQKAARFNRNRSGFGMDYDCSDSDSDGDGSDEDEDEDEDGSDY
jgi:hypothetical protein